MDLFKIGKTTAGLLSAALVLGAVAAAPMVFAETKSSNKGHGYADGHADLGTVNVEKLGEALIKRGKIKKGATPDEVERAVRDYVTKRGIPHGVDTSTKFGKQAEKGLEGMRAESAEKAGAGNLKKSAGVHSDNIALALVEFPDYPHNSLEEEEGSLYTKDFSSSHYAKMLFDDQYKTPEGLKLTTMKQYYQEQSGGTWNLAGTVTPWTKAKHDAAYYGGNDPNFGDNDKAPRELVTETLASVGKSIQGQEARYDQRDPYDIDGDGTVMEADGFLDNLMLVHSGIGEEAGGGEMGPDAIWSHRWTLKQPTAIPGTSLKAYDYMIQPEDGAVGVFAHEYGHNIGLPDLYDTTRLGLGSPVGSWSLMSSGSWNGKILGTEPTGFDPWSKLFLQATFGGHWSHPNEIDLKDIGGKKSLQLEEAVSKNLFGKTLKINLPDVEKQPPTQPKSGEYAYYSTMGDNVNTKMTSGTIDLSGASDASLTFDSWREIEAGYDYLYVNVIDEATGQKTEVKAYDDETGGQWASETLDLSAFAGKKVKLEFNYVTDGGLAMEGFYVDNIAVTAGGQQVFEDGAEGEPKFDLSGFKRFDGTGTMHPSYYLVEWRTHNGMDQGLANYRRGNSFFTYDPGMVVWHYDGRYLDNNTGEHPGYGLVGVVDAHQRMHYWNEDYSKPASDRYLVNDAAFGLGKTSPLNIENYLTYGDLKYPSQSGVPTFYDHKNYSQPGAPSVGKILPKYGLKITVEQEKKAGKAAVIGISKK